MSSITDLAEPVGVQAKCGDIDISATAAELDERRLKRIDQISESEAGIVLGHPQAVIC
jgi:hypothetical protein